MNEGGRRGIQIVQRRDGAMKELMVRGKQKELEGVWKRQRHCCG